MTKGCGEKDPNFASSAIHFSPCAVSSRTRKSTSSPSFVRRGGPNADLGGHLGVIKLLARPACPQRQQTRKLAKLLDARNKGDILLEESASIIVEVTGWIEKGVTLGRLRLVELRPAAAKEYVAGKQVGSLQLCCRARVKRNVGRPPSTTLPTSLIHLSFDLREKCGGVLGFVDNKGLSVFAQKKARITFSE